MKTKWGESLDKNKVLAEYPRPQMERESYLNLKQNKCDVIQGYLFSRPVPAEEIEHLYHQNLIEQREDKISNL